jgi:hypothetical protein
MAHVQTLDAAACDMLKRNDMSEMCGAPDASVCACPRCREPILEEDRTLRLAFDGDAIEFLGWILLFILSSLLVIPSAWTIAAFGRWFWRNLRLQGSEALLLDATGGSHAGHLQVTETT